MWWLINIALLLAGFAMVDASVRFYPACYNNMQTLIFVTGCMLIGGGMVSSLIKWLLF